LVTAGAISSRYIGVSGVHNAVERHAASRAELPIAGRELSPGEPAIPTEYLDLPKVELPKK